MNGKAWAMNCVLAGARAMLLLQRGEEEKLREDLKKLTSEFRLEDVDYIIFRLQGLTEEVEVEALDERISKLETKEG